MLSRSNGSETVTYDWFNDGENRLAGVKVTNANGTQEQKYIYDSDGNRVASIIDGVRTNYLVAGDLPQVLMEYDALGRVTASYTYGFGMLDYCTDVYRKRKANQLPKYYDLDFFISAL